MSERPDPQIRIAFIKMWQAIIVAIIFALGGYSVRGNQVAAQKTVPDSLEIESLRSTVSRLNQELEAKNIEIRKIGANQKASSKDASISYINYGWIDIKSKQSFDVLRCKSIAADSLSESGATDVEATASHTVFGRKEGYSFFVACLTNNNIVIVGSSGPNSIVGKELGENLKNQLEGKI